MLVNTIGGRGFSSDDAPTPAARPAAPLQIVLFQYKICPYCNKVKALLDFLRIPYTAREVNPVSKAELASEGLDGAYKKVPVCLVDGQQVNDSSVILARVLTEFAARSHSSSNAPAARTLIGVRADGSVDDEQARWMEWADRKLAVLLFPNITRSMKESMQAFSYIWDVPHFSMMDKVVNRLAGAVAMRLAQGKIKKKYVLCVTGWVMT